MLLALVSVARGSELQKIKPQFISDYGDRMVINVPGLTKTKRPSHPQLSFALHTFSDNGQICVVTCLREYLQRTLPLRVSDTQQDSLFISHIRPHHKVASCTIARWLKEVMASAGIDVQIFKAHSARAAAVSKAREQGVSPAQIVDCANWSNASTFRTFYNKPIVSDSDAMQGFQRSILRH